MSTGKEFQEKSNFRLYKQYGLVIFHVCVRCGDFIGLSNVAQCKCAAVLLK
jgi:hypothetical protein